MREFFPVKIDRGSFKSHPLSPVLLTNIPEEIKREFCSYNTYKSESVAFSMNQRQALRCVCGEETGFLKCICCKELMIKEKGC